MFNTFKKTVLYCCIVYHYSLKLPYILLRKIVMASRHLETAGCREMIAQDAIRVVVSDLLISIRERGFFPSLCNQRRSASVNVAEYDIWKPNPFWHWRHCLLQHAMHTSVNDVLMYRCCFGKQQTTLNHQLRTSPSLHGRRSHHARPLMQVRCSCRPVGHYQL